LYVKEILTAKYEVSIFVVWCGLCLLRIEMLHIQRGWRSVYCRKKETKFRFPNQRICFLHLQVNNFEKRRCWWLLFERCSEKINRSI